LALLCTRSDGQAGTTAFDTFGPHGSFDTVSGLLVSGETSPDGAYGGAVSFVPSASGNLQTVTVAVGLLPPSGGRTFSLALRQDSGGLPNGPLIEQLAGVFQHLLRAGVDINTIRAWLGLLPIPTTHIHAESDLQIKAQALAQCEASRKHRSPPRRSGDKLLAFLRAVQAITYVA
jgi:hypothetical protein